MNKDRAELLVLKSLLCANGGEDLVQTAGVIATAVADDYTAANVAAAVQTPYDTPLRQPYYTRRSFETPRTGIRAGDYVTKESWSGDLKGHHWYKVNRVEGSHIWLDTRHLPDSVGELQYEDSDKNLPWVVLRTVK